MRLAVKMSGFALATAVLGITLLPGATTHAASGEEVIKARINFMNDDLDKKYWRVLGAYAAKGQGSLADVEKAANALANLAEKIPGHFPKDTGRGNYPDKLTRSLPDIWMNWEGFNKDVRRLADQSRNLARLAREGQKDEVVAIIGKSGRYAQTKLGCTECHENFRGDRVK
jgi:cytochrome c556